MPLALKRSGASQSKPWQDSSTFRLVPENSVSFIYPLSYTCGALTVQPRRIALQGVAGDLTCPVAQLMASEGGDKLAHWVA